MRPGFLGRRKRLQRRAGITRHHLKRDERLREAGGYGGPGARCQAERRLERGRGPPSDLERPRFAKDEGPPP